MEHAEAIEKMMAEQYALGELLETDRDAFEQHFFDCPECATDVRDAVTLLDSGRAMMREPRVVVSSRRANWWATAATAASIAAFGVVGYQSQVVIPQVAREARIEGQHSARIGGVTQFAAIDLSAVRGDTPAAADIAVKANQPFVFTLSSLPSKPLQAVIRSGGQTVQSYPISAEQAKGFVTLTFTGLPAGHHELIIDSVPSQEKPVATYSLEAR